MTPPYRRRVADHPRIRGEHFPTPGGTGPCQGSSPHTRGALSDAWRHWPVSGIIPAYAGSTSTTSLSAVMAGDHPRIRGEHVFEQVNERVRAGSSPHTRGALSAPVHECDRGWIIPAYAGSTTGVRLSHGQRRDHPRIRGEHTAGSYAVGIPQGSSPHTRGARPAVLPLPGLAGIIPAYAGSTSPTHRPEPPFSGSSPHTRGAPEPTWASPDEARIIPAYAGSTTLRLL